MDRQTRAAMIQYDESQSKSSVGGRSSGAHPVHTCSYRDMVTSGTC